MNTGDYPVGAANDPKAPYNEPLDVKHRRCVSLTISYYATVEGSPDMSEEQIRDAIRADVEAGKIPEGFYIDDFYVMEE